MKRTALLAAATASLLASPIAAFATCTVTVPVGGNIQATLNAYAGQTARICLEEGIHSIGSNKLNIHQNQTLSNQGTGFTRPLIVGSASRVIEAGAPNVTIERISVSGSGEFGILAFSSGFALRDSDVTGNVKIGVGLNGASSATLQNVSVYNIGKADGLADPSLWINSSSNVVVTSGYFSNYNQSPGGDGEVACYNSTGVSISSSSVLDSGAAGFYLVNCDGAQLTGNLVSGAREWGIDIVDGSDGVAVSNNTVRGSRNGGSVLLNSLNATFSSNVWELNRQGGSGKCNGVNRRGSTTGFTQSGDVSIPSSGGVSCFD